MVPDHVTLTAWLTRLRLTAIRDQLDSLLDEAARKELTLREAVGFLCEREIARREDRRIEMAGKIAHFPTVRELDGFDFTAQPSIDPRQIGELAACRWVAHGMLCCCWVRPGWARRTWRSRWAGRRSARATPYCSLPPRHWWRVWRRRMPRAGWRNGSRSMPSPSC